MVHCCCRCLTGTTSAGEVVRTLCRVSLRACTGTGLGHDEWVFAGPVPIAPTQLRCVLGHGKSPWGNTPGHPVCPVPAFIVAPWPSVFWSFAEDVMTDAQTPGNHRALRALLRSAHIARYRRRYADRAPEPPRTDIVPQAAIQTPRTAP